MMPKFAAAVVLSAAAILGGCQTSGNISAADAPAHATREGTLVVDESVVVSPAYATDPADMLETLRQSGETLGLRAMELGQTRMVLYTDTEGSASPVAAVPMRITVDVVKVAANRYRVDLTGYHTGDRPAGDAVMQRASSTLQNWLTSFKTRAERA